MTNVTGDDATHIIVCPGCSGCLEDVTDDDVELEHELTEMMAERPDGNRSEPAHCLHQWNPRLTGKTYTTVKRRSGKSIEELLSRARSA